MASEDNTKVSFNGIVVATLNAGEIYPSAFTSNPVTLTTATSITADKPVCVTEYAQTSACSGTNNGDPDMVILNPIEQNIKDITIFSSTQQNINRQWLNVLIKTIAAPSFRIDGAVPSTAFQPAPNIPGYSYLKHLFTPATQGSHFLQADSGFNAICYGFQAGQFESYAYSAGTNVKDLYQQIGVSTEYGIEPTPSVCNGSPFKFKVSLPYCADSISWDLSFLPGPPIPAPTSIYSTCTAGAGGPDSTTVVNGVTLYWYSLPSIYAFNVSGSYPVTITTYTPNLDGCGTEQDIDFELNVYDPPVADFNITNSGCIAEAVRFFDNTTTPRPSYIWNWDFGDPGSGPANTSGLQNPSHLFSAPGTYTVKFSTITTPGCISSEITKQVTVAPVPTATIAGTTTVCLNDPQPPITFTATDGTAPYTFSYHINGGPAIHLSSPTNTSTVNVPTNVAGTFTYYLDSVKNTGSSLCVTNYTNTFAEVVVNANTGLALDAGSNNSQAVCKNSSIANIFYTISGGGTNATISWLPAPPAGLTGVYNLATKKFNISGTPTVAGVYTYTVQATGPCLPNQLSGTITVNEIPTASITGTTEVCLNAPSPPVTFTGAGGVAPYTFNYKLNGVPQTPIISAGNTYVINVPTNVATTLIYDLTNVTDASSTLCSQAQIGTATVIVNSLPTALFNVTAPTCESRVLTFTDLSTPNSGALNGWAWTFGDATTSNQQNPTHTYPAAGTYTVTLTVTTDKGCASLPIASIPVTVNTRPQAGFIVPEVCINDAATVFTDTSHISTGSFSPVGYYWDFGDPGSGPANTSTTMNGSHLYTAIGLYHVMHVATSTLGCTDTVYNDIFINAADPVADYTLTNLAALCSSDSVSLINKSTIGQGSVTKLQIYWDVIGAPATFDLDDNPVFNGVYKHKYPTLTTTQNYTVRLIAYSGNVCFTNKTTVITVNATPKVQFLNMPDACLDAAPFQITQATEIGAVAGTGVFSGPGVNATGIFNPALVGPGTYTIKYVYTSSAAGCVDSLSKDITVLDSASANFTYSSTACEKSSINFSSGSSTIPAASGTITGWSWNFGDPSSGAANTSTQANPTHTFNNWGTYNVTLFVTTSNGCKSTVRTNAVVSCHPVKHPASHKDNLKTLNNKL